MFVGLDDWDIIAPVDVPQHRIYNLVDKNSILGTLTGSISSGVGKTFSNMQRAMGKIAYYIGQTLLKHNDSNSFQPITSFWRKYQDRKTPIDFILLSVDTWLLVCCVTHIQKTSKYGHGQTNIIHIFIPVKDLDFNSSPTSCLLPMGETKSPDFRSRFRISPDLHAISLKSTNLCGFTEVMAWPKPIDRVTYLLKMTTYYGLGNYHTQWLLFIKDKQRLFHHFYYHLPT